jgi:hypothetical protein
LVNTYQKHKSHDDTIQIDVKILLIDSNLWYENEIFDKYDTIINRNIKNRNGDDNSGERNEDEKRVDGYMDSPSSPLIGDYYLYMYIYIYICIYIYVYTYIYG